ncbi:anillin [Cydia splendana]|uniref:anillin n=1 Tax=Cydia splendana TaxID=1100963 RepID=UPI00300C1BE5
MDPFTQRMLERARARQEKIDQKLASSGQTPRRKPLSENVSILKKDVTPTKSPSKGRDSISSPRKSSRESLKSESPIRSPRSSKADTVAKPRNDFIVTKKEFGTPKRGSVNRRNSDVSVEINIMHRNDIQIEVQVEERDAPIDVVYKKDSGVIVKEIEDDTSKRPLETNIDEVEHKTEKTGIKNNLRNKSRLDRLGNLYSDTPTLSSPIHRTEQDFHSATPPKVQEAKTRPRDGKKFGRLAALADQINNWEDDLTHHNIHPEPTKEKKNPIRPTKKEEQDASTLDISIHSINDINKALHTVKSDQTSKSSTSKHTFTKPGTPLDKKTVAVLEHEGYRRVSASQSRLVYDFTTETADRTRQEPKRTSTTPSAAATPNMAAAVAHKPAITKKPSIKKYKAPTPPVEENCDSDKDKENNVVAEENHNNETNCVQTKDSPIIKRFAPKTNNDRSSVLSRAAMFEAGSPKAKDPAEMSLRERKALFEKNKGAAIVPKAPFGQAPSAKTLMGDKDKKPAIPTTPTKTRRNSQDEDSISVTSVGGIKGKLAALFNKEQTISETTIANKFKQEREREMEMLQNRFHYKPKPEPEQPNDSDEDQNDNDPSEKAPLMGSTTSLTPKKPEVIANIPKVTFDEARKAEERREKIEEKIAGAQPVKRRSSQDSPVVLSVLEDVKRIKVNNTKEPNGTVTSQPASIYPHLSDIETDNSNTQDEYSDCGGSSQENINDNLNKSDNWAETSFGREVMNVVKKNNSSYKKAVKESDSEDSQSECNSELDELLDEALDESDGPTPPKLNKNGSLSSTSFVYQDKEKQFKSPLKTQPATPRADKGSELVHSVSFYRRMQSASSTPSTPMRVIRHTSPEREIPATPDEPAANVTTVRQRIKELQAEVAKQQTVISQASQALNLCAATIEFSGSTEQAEGERLLLLATHRRQACLHEIQRLQVEGAGAGAAPGMAAIHIDSLSVPLRREYVRQLNADGAVGHHAVCLLKCRDRVLATSMQLTQPTSHLLHFPDEIRMEGLASDFKITVEVYLLQASKEILPHEVKYHISNKKCNNKLLTPKSKVSELKTPRVQSPGGPLSVRSPQLQLHGYCIFALQQASRKSFTLNKVPGGSPLEGSINLGIAARLRVAAPAPHAAFLTAFDDVSGLGAWHRRWFRLQPPRLAYWKYPDDVQKKMPIGDIDLTTVISDKVVRAPRDLCARPHTLLLETTAPRGLIVPDSGSLVYFKRADGAVVRRHLLAADTAKDRDEWLECLNKALEYVRCCPDNE